MNRIPRQPDVWDVNALHRSPEFVPLNVDTLPRYTQTATIHATAADLLAHALMEEVDARLESAGYDLDSPVLDAPDLRDVANEATSAATMLGLLALDPEVPAGIRPTMAVAAHRVEWLSLQLAHVTAALNVAL